MIVLVFLLFHFAFSKTINQAKPRKEKHLREPSSTTRTTKATKHSSSVDYDGEIIILNAFHIIVAISLTLWVRLENVSSKKWNRINFFGSNVKSERRGFRSDTVFAFMFWIKRDRKLTRFGLYENDFSRQIQHRMQI